MDYFQSQSSKRRVAVVRSEKKGWAASTSSAESTAAGSECESSGQRRDSVRADGEHLLNNRFSGRDAQRMASFPPTPLKKYRQRRKRHHYEGSPNDSDHYVDSVSASRGGSLYLYEGRPPGRQNFHCWSQPKFKCSPEPERVPMPYFVLSACAISSNLPPATWCT